MIIEKRLFEKNTLANAEGLPDGLYRLDTDDWDTILGILYTINCTYVENV